MGKWEQGKDGWIKWRGVGDNEKVRTNALYMLLGLKDLKIWLVRKRRT